MNEFQVSDDTYYPSSQSDASSVRHTTQEWTELHKDRVRLLLMNDPNQALLLLNRSNPKYTARVPCVPTQPNGYIQVLSLMR